MTPCNEPGCVDGRTPHKGPDSWGFPSGVPCPRCSSAAHKPAPCGDGCRGGAYCRADNARAPPETPSPAKAAVEAVCEVLKPCPFDCGVVPSIIKGRNCFTVGCSGSCIAGDRHIGYSTAKDAEKDWNRRPSPAPQSVEAVGEERVRELRKHTLHQRDRQQKHCNDGFDGGDNLPCLSRLNDTIKAFDDLLTTRASLQEMRGEVERLTANARRYEWLRTRISRECVTETSGDLSISFQRWYHIDYLAVLESDHIDEYIDRATLQKEATPG